MVLPVRELTHPADSREHGLWEAESRDEESP